MCVIGQKAQAPNILSQTVYIDQKHILENESTVRGEFNFWKEKFPQNQPIIKDDKNLGTSAFLPITHPILELLVWKLICMSIFHLKKKLNIFFLNIFFCISKIDMHINFHTNSPKIG